MEVSKNNYHFSGWATKYNLPCSDGRTIMPGAFAHCDGKVVPMVWNHDHKNMENVIGHAEIRQTYKISGVGTIGGCYVTDGKIQRNCEVRIVRDGIVVHEGMMNSLKRFKDDAKEVPTGYECGIGIERFNDIKEGDVIECFVMEEIPR